jgi:hypothetical protein
MTISAGKYINVGTKIARGIKDTPEFLQIEDYTKNIDEAMQWKVILSDTETQQHWLADGASVILHLCRAWLSGKHTRLTPRGKTFNLWTPSSPAGPETSFDTLTSDDNRQIQLYPSTFKRESKASSSEELSDSPDKSQVTNEWFLFEHQAQCFYHWLEQIHDRTLNAQHSGTIDLSRKGTKAIGFEFKDMLSSSKRLNPFTLDCGDGASAWLPYARSVNAVHIFGTHFGNLLVPTKGRLQRLGQCDLEDAAPEGKDSLMAPLSVLREGIERLKHTDACAQLARGVYWNDVENSFAICRCRRQHADGLCKAFIRKLQAEGSLGTQPRAAAVDLAGIFLKRPAAAVIFGGEPTSRVNKAYSQLTSRIRGRKGTEGESSKRLKPSAADSGYSSNGRTSSSHELDMTQSPTSDRITAAEATHDDDEIDGPRKRRRLRDSVEREVEREFSVPRIPPLASRHE